MVLSTAGTLAFFDSGVQGQIQVRQTHLSAVFSIMHSSLGAGIFIEDSSAFIRSSVIADAARSGIEIVGNSDVYVTDSSIFNNSGRGLEIDLAGDVSATLNVNDSSISSNGSHGVSANGSGVTMIVANNTIFNNGGDGVGVVPSTAEVVVTHSSFALNARNLWGSFPVESSVLLNVRDGAATRCLGDVTLSNSIVFGGDCGQGGTKVDPSTGPTFGSFDDHGCAPEIETPIGCPFTIELLPGNPALNVGDCTDNVLGIDDDGEFIRYNLLSDQRHEPRDPFFCDAGAFELNDRSLPERIAITAPARQSALSCGVATLRWTGRIDGEYSVRAGSTPGATGYLNASVGSERSYDMVGLPEDGSMVYVELWFTPNGGSPTRMDATTYAACDSPFGSFVDHGVPTWSTSLDSNEVAMNAAGLGALIALKENGDLYLRRFSEGGAFEPWVRLGRGGWASAGVAIDDSGRVEIVGTKADGRLYTQSWLLSGRFGPWTSHGRPTWRTTAQPSITTDGTTIMIGAVKDDGRLYLRQRSTSGAWGGYTQQGRAGWANVDLDIAPDGDVWMIASKTDGRLYARKRLDGVWSGYSLQGRPTWSPRLAPTVTAHNDGVVFGAIKADGRLYTRAQNEGRWSAFAQHGRSEWIAVSIDRSNDGRTALLALKDYGRLYTRTHEGVWGSWVRHGADTWADQAGPSITSSTAGTTLTVVGADGGLYTRQEDG